MRNRKWLIPALLGAAAIVILCIFIFKPAKLVPSDFCGTVTSRVSVQLHESETNLQDGIFLTIANHSGERFVGTRWFVVEVLKNGVWYSMPYITDPVFREDGYEIAPFSASPVEPFPVHLYYGTLEPGTYRLISEDSIYCKPGSGFLPENHYFVFEFTV